IIFVQTTTQSMKPKPGGSQPEPIGLNPTTSYYTLQDLRVKAATFKGPSTTNSGKCSFSMQVENPNSTFPALDKYGPSVTQRIRQVPSGAVCEGTWDCNGASRGADGSVVLGIRCSNGW